MAREYRWIHIASKLTTSHRDKYLITCDCAVFVVTRQSHLKIIVFDLLLIKCYAMFPLLMQIITY